MIGRTNKDKAVENFIRVLKFGAWCILPGFLIGLVAMFNSTGSDAGLMPLVGGVIGFMVGACIPATMFVWFLLLTMLGQVTETLKEPHRKPKRYRHEVSVTARRSSSRRIFSKDIPSER